MLEKIAAFFEACLQDYDGHMLKNIAGAEEFYRFDTPLTVEHEMKALQSGGFARVEILKNWGATYVLRATK